MNWKQPKVYAVKHKDEATRAASRSGGIFTALSDRVLSDGGVVYGCILTDDFSAVHTDSSGSIKSIIFRQVELLDKCMVLGVVVPKIIPQMMQFKKLHQYQIDMNAFGGGNLSSIQPALRHLIDFITVQHQVGCESVMLVKKDVLVLNGQKLVQGMQVHKQLMLKIMSEGIAAHHLLCLFVQLAIDKDQRLIKIERK